MLNHTVIDTDFVHGLDLDEVIERAAQLDEPTMADVLAATESQPVCEFCGAPVYGENDPWDAHRMLCKDCEISLRDRREESWRPEDEYDALEG